MKKRTQQKRQNETVIGSNTIDKEVTVNMAEYQFSVCVCVCVDMCCYYKMHNKFDDNMFQWQKIKYYDDAAAEINPPMMIYYLTDCDDITI